MYITTYTGRHVNPLDPHPEDFCIEDIAHSLSQQVRFTGHTRLPLTIAEHSLNVSYLCPKEHQLAGLLHDASETYLVDLPSPIKHDPEMGIFVLAEDRLQHAIATAFDIPFGFSSHVHIADKLALGIEARDLMNVADDPNWAKWIDPIRDHPLSVSQPMSPRVAEMHFLAKYYELTYNHSARSAIAPAVKGGS